MNPRTSSGGASPLLQKNILRGSLCSLSKEKCNKTEASGKRDFFVRSTHPSVVFLLLEKLFLDKSTRAIRPNAYKKRCFYSRLYLRIRINDTTSHWGRTNERSMAMVLTGFFPSLPPLFHKARPLFMQPGKVTLQEGRLTAQRLQRFAVVLMLMAD